MQENNKIWPPEPSRPSGVPGPVINPKLPPGLLTNHPVWDLLVGLFAGPVVHVLLLLCSVSLARRYEYAPWGLAVVGAILLFAFLFRRYPYLMAGFIVASISVAVFSFIVVSIAPV